MMPISYHQHTSNDYTGFIICGGERRGGVVEGHYDNSTLNRFFKNETTSIILSFGDSDEILNSNETRRVRRSTDGAGVTRKPCERFNIELIVIPLCVAMIPIGLCALLLCTCCCGPKDSRGKLPDNFLKTIASSASIGKRCTSEEMELEYRDGYVQRKDSTKTKFSTVVSYIEPPRRSSVWSIRTNNSIEGSEEDLKCGDEKREEQTSTTQNKISKSSSSGSIVRFNEQVSVLGVDELKTGKR
ncbi:unnamed protein product, partial [Mesorhabditis belari]|uniref:Uncharacterized protein n=1 Tax=Mesorhabditis belari TaxID=2138241 RepID=A0AAF3F029_9BILA